MSLPNNRPVIVYDDDCGFCTWSARWAVRHGPFDAVGFANLTPDQRDRLPADFEDCAHLLTANDVYSCGAATEWTILRIAPSLHWLFVVIRLVPGYTRIRERLYRWVADHRAWLGSFLSAEPPIERE
jgi:predicted DCC family thiol-disulfide oxidoreductase YuxK